MRARSSRNDAATMDLFPFMAVLICTVGALIMLLVVMVQQARVKAREPRQSAAQQTALEAEQLQAEQQALDQLQAKRDAELADHQRRQEAAKQKQWKVDELLWKSEMLRSSYEQAVGQLADQRKSLSHLESHARELSEKAGAMQAEADLIAETAKQSSARDEKVGEQLNDIQKAIESAETELEKQQGSLRETDTKYVLLPYKGPHGTNRRPIYIECLPDRVVMQPEGVLLIGEDFLPPITAENPLARALRAKREFLLDNGLIGQDEEPYPLLVVRPGGAASYAAARSAMASWESEFGYELVEQGVELSYLDADPRLRDLLEDIVLETRGRRRMFRSAQAQSQPRRRERLRPSASGGFESVSTGGNDYAGSRGDSRNLPFGSESGVTGRQGSGGFSDGRSFGSRESRAGLGNASGESIGQNGPRYGQAGYGPGLGGHERAADGQPNRFTGTGFGGTEFGSDSHPQGNHAGTGAEFGQGFSGSGNSKANSQSGPYERNGSNGNGPWSGADESGSVSGSMAGARDAQSTASELDSAGHSTPGDRTSSNLRADSAGNPFRGGGGGAGPAGGGGNSAEATGSGGPGATGSGGSSSVANAQDGSPSGGMSMGGNPASLAASRGGGWAARPRQPADVGLQRPIYVHCDAETLTLLPEKGTTQTAETWQHRGSADRVVDAFVTSIQRRLTSWGIAGQGFYWKPVLKVRVRPQDEVIYQQLKQLLDNSGIEVARQP